MTKLCPRGKAAAKRKFKVYPSAYANAYASRICAGKIKDPSGVKRKDFKGRKPAAEGGKITKGVKEDPKRDQKKQPLKTFKLNEDKKKKRLNELRKELGMKGGGLMEATQRLKRTEKMGGGMMRPMYRKGGGVCLRGMNREAIGKNS